MSMYKYMTTIYFYKVISNNSDLIYIGSTLRDLKHRLSAHKSSYNMYLKNKFNYVSVFDVLAKGNNDIVLLDSAVCINSKERYTKEGFYIKNNICVNRLIPGRDFKGYYEDNKRRIIDKCMAYNLINKDIIKAKGSQKILCVCCSVYYTLYNKSSHYRSARHLSFS